MRTAICLTPDRRYFGPALFTASRIIAAGLPADTDVLLLCEEEDIWPNYEALDPAIRGKLILLSLSFASIIGDVPVTNNGSTAIYRRLVLDRVLPQEYRRIVAIDADIDIAREGLAGLTTLDLGGNVIAAAIDMIFLMDFGGDLAPRFQAYRQRLGLSLATPYFNNGFIVIDRDRWESGKLGERAIRFIVDNPRACEFFDQSALNALLNGAFAPLSPRYNFMGDFFLLDVEREIAPIVYHFVNKPKPWEQGFAGESRFAESYWRWFASSPWPDFVAPPQPFLAPPQINAAFRACLLEFLARQRFADGWTPKLPDVPGSRGFAT